MATNANLPAGFFITTIGTQRCTAVPRALTTVTGDSATAAAAAPAQPPTTASSEAALASIPAAVPAQVVPTSVASPVVQPGTPDTILSLTTSKIPPAAAPSTSAATVPASIVAPSVLASTAIATPISSDATAPTVVPASLPGATSPTASSSPQATVSPSEMVYPPTVATLYDDNGVVLTTLSQTSSSPTLLSASTPKPKESSASSGISQDEVSAGPVVGGVLGAMGLLASIAFFFWFLKKRKRSRDSLLSYLNSGRLSPYDDADAVSMGRENNWWAKLGHSTDRARNIGSDVRAGLSAAAASLRSMVLGDRSYSPSVNLNRGNSQFRHGPIPQHSRNNSDLSVHAHTGLREKASEWQERLGEIVTLAWRPKSEPADHFSAPRGMSEKQAEKHSPILPQLLGLADWEMQAVAEQRRASRAGQSNPPPHQVGSLGLSSSNDDPLADPKSSTTIPAAKDNTSTNPFADPAPNINHSADPISRPNPTTQRTNTYIADVRRSRGQSIDATTTVNNATSIGRAHSRAGHARYPSSPAPSRDSYRDTVPAPLFANANARKGRGLPDPFDLERPDLWKPRELSASNLYSTPRNSRSSAYSQKQAHISGVSTRAWKYSDKGPALRVWGDSGQDLGPASRSSSLMASPSSRGGSFDLRYSFPDGWAI
ncbi:hypothetical protein B2J93_3761 [Marssonina coronariae]|uniref:Uncharacterized protein n=1 Tax=Diplocarpon coronariae TaxID=2795749 RepID=A0A218YTN7_9HELO|nr:hypothetical protein B2J93_3761 [Marssonina coronariae]